MLKAKINLLVPDEFEPIKIMDIRKVEDLDFSSQKFICSQYTHLDLQKKPKKSLNSKPPLRRPSSFCRQKQFQFRKQQLDQVKQQQLLLIRFKNITSGQLFQMEVESDMSGFDLLTKINERYPGKNVVLQMNQESGSDAMVIDQFDIAVKSVKQLGYTSQTILYVKT